MNLHLMVVACLLAGCSPALSFGLQHAQVSTQAQTNSRADSSKLSHEEALGLMRTIGGALATVESRSKKYPSLQEVAQALQELFQDPDYQRYARNSVEVTVRNDGTVKAKNYTLSLVVSADGRSFEARLMPSDACDTAYFLGDSFVIYEAKALGCSE